MVTPVFNHPRYQVYRGDSAVVLPHLADASYDLVLTDPPYGISFMGKAWDRALPNPEIWRQSYRLLKPGGSALVMSGARADCLWRMCRDLEEAGFELAQSTLWWVYFSGFPKVQNLSIAAGKQAGAEREVLGIRDKRYLSPRTTAVFSEQRGSDNEGSYGLGAAYVSAPATDLARSLDGWYSKGKVKPAVEVIIWARKPISEKTELDNMTKWGVGGVNCGACMVPSDEPIPVNVLPSWSGFGQLEKPDYVQKQQTGRYPANLLCQDNALGDGSRYFDVDKWADEHGITEDGWAEAAAAGVLQIAKPPVSEKEAGLLGFVPCTTCGGIDSIEHKDGREKMVPCKRNGHPTIKPVTLMAYLINFLTRPGATVLDPFAGSGSTLVGALQSGRRAVGVELDAEDEGFIDIIGARCRQALLDATPEAEL